MKQLSFSSKVSSRDQRRACCARGLLAAALLAPASRRHEVTPDLTISRYRTEVGQLHSLHQKTSSREDPGGSKQTQILKPVLKETSQQPRALVATAPGANKGPRAKCRPLTPLLKENTAFGDVAPGSPPLRRGVPGFRPRHAGSTKEPRGPPYCAFVQGRARHFCGEWMLMSWPSCKNLTAAGFSRIGLHG